MNPKNFQDYPIPQRRYNISPYEKPNYWPVVIGFAGLVLLSVVLANYWDEAQEINKALSIKP